ncbi:hypothetical protein ES703_124880 [subsurface metagenome]
MGNWYYIDPLLWYYGIVAVMSKTDWLAVLKGGSALVAMVLIWRLVETALLMGIDGVMFFVGVAAIAGLGGYQIRWLIDAVKARNAKGNSGK